jgi:hypothetical protein
MRVRLAALFTLLSLLLLAAPPARAGLSPQLEKALQSSQYVYIQSTRKSGELGAPAEIWFFYHDGAVYVGTRPTSWRVKRIKAGRPAAKIAVGSPDGPSFMATGSLVKDPATEALLMQAYAKKYPQAWATHAENFRQGFKDGSRVLVKYAPK